MDAGNTAGSGGVSGEVSGDVSGEEVQNITIFRQRRKHSGKGENIQARVKTLLFFR